MNRMNLPTPFDPFDEIDALVLAGVRSLYATADPMPADLLRRIEFALEPDYHDVEVLRPDRSAALVAVRGDDASRSITFDSDQLTIMVTITDQPDSTLLIDGWLAPPGDHHVELRTQAGRSITTADEHGRFVLTGIARGLAQFAVTRAGAAGTGQSPSFVTPSILL